MSETRTDERRYDSRFAMATAFMALALWWLGRGPLSTPPVDSWPEFRGWLAVHSTAEASIAALRASAFVCAAYLAAASALAMIARNARSVSLMRFTHALLPRSLRPLIGFAVTASLATSAVSVVVPRTAPRTEIATRILTPTDATATMFLVDASTTTVPAAAQITEVSSTTTSKLVTTAAPPAPVPNAPAPAPAATSTRTENVWIIERGEHLWLVAHETLADAWGRSPTDSEVTPYWQALIDHNRSRLIDPSNPDYVVPGQAFELPPVPARSTR